MHRPTGRDRLARRPAPELCEDRILQSIAVEPAGPRTPSQQQPADTPDGSRIVVFYRATLDHASGRFDDPFFFDAN
jgi:hypothetical protein